MATDRKRKKQDGRGRRKKKEGPEVLFSDRELDLMNVLWDQGSATVHETRDQLEDELAYTTVLTIFQTLEEKGRVRHEQEGRAYRYYPNVDRDEAGRSAVSYMLRKVFSGSPELLLTHLVQAADVTDEQIRRMRRRLDQELDGKKA